MLKNLRAEMTRQDLKAADVAKAIGKTERSTRDKLNGITGFTLSEAIAIRDTFFPGLSLEYLFDPDDT